jgi:hypothetical protein
VAINATAIWRVRPSGSNTNGGGYDPGIAGAATDYSQQNAAQASGTHGSGVATTTFTDTTAAAFTSAMVGNCINIQGQGFYFVVTFTDASHVVVDRALGTFSGASWALGGGWANPFTNASTTGPIVPGNKGFILGSGIPNPAAYTFDYTWSAQTALAAGSTAGGSVIWANDPSTPSYKAPPDTSGGMPVIKVTANLALLVGYHKYQGIYFVGSGLAAGNAVVEQNNSGTIASSFFGCVYDQNATDSFFINDNYIDLIGSEIFSSVGATGTSFAVICSSSVLLGCNIHDVVGNGVEFGGGRIINCIIAKCKVDAIQANVGILSTILNNTIDGNGRHGINITGGSAGDTVSRTVIFNNIISNHTAGGAVGFTVSNGTLAANTALSLADYNCFYNNTTNYSSISAGAHDTALGSNPYVGQATENYTLA